MNNRAMLLLRMQRQHLIAPADEGQYNALYRDLQPGMNVYWHGFGQPPVLSFRADFDDMGYNQARQGRRDLVKGRFAGGNLGWIVPEDLPLFAAVYRKPIVGLMDDVQHTIITLIEQLGPLNIQQIKEETGLLVKVITPALHRLQEAFLLYEDQYDGEWDRAWYRFGEMFPDIDLNQFSREEAIDMLLQRFAHRTVWFDTKMARSFFRIPEKELKAACTRLTEAGKFAAKAGGYLLAADLPLVEGAQETPFPPVLALHRNDPLVRMMEHDLKARFRPLCDALPYDHDPQYYLLVEGALRGVSVGHFRYGPYEIQDIVCDSPDMWAYRQEICDAVQKENPGSVIQRFMGKKL